MALEFSFEPGEKAKDPRATLELLLALRETSTPPRAEDVRDYVSALIGRKNYELAYYAWLQFLPPEQLSSTGFLFNGSFDVTPSGLPFDWVMGEGSGVTMDIVDRPDQPDQRALLVEFGHGRVEFNGIQQLTMLAPGTYEFKGRYRGELVGKRGLVWRITCAGAPSAPLGASPMVVGASPKWKDIEFSFTVPETDCRAQQYGSSSMRACPPSCWSRAPSGMTSCALHVSTGSSDRERHLRRGGRRQRRSRYSCRRMHRRMQARRAGVCHYGRPLVEPLQRTLPPDEARAEQET